MPNNNLPTEREWRDYVSGARKKIELHFAGKTQISDPEYFLNLWRKASGLCPVCGEKKKVTNFERRTDTENRTETVQVRFACGHGDISVFVNESIRVQDSLRVSSVGISKDHKKGIRQKLSARIQGFKQTKESEERQAVRRLCMSQKPFLNRMSGYKQNSAIDVVASGVGKTEYFQVTKLYGQDFWRPLNTRNSVDLVVENMTALIGEAIRRKMAYSASERSGLILVIDAWPGIDQIFVEPAKAALGSLLKESRYLEVWLVGENHRSIYRLF